MWIEVTANTKQTWCVPASTVLSGKHTHTGCAHGPASSDVAGVASGLATVMLCRSVFGDVSKVRFDSNSALTAGFP
jgi:hypothetical protein